MGPLSPHSNPRQQLQNWDALHLLVGSPQAQTRAGRNCPGRSATRICRPGELSPALKVPGQPDKLETIRIWNLALTARKTTGDGGRTKKGAPRAAGPSIPPGRVGLLAIARSFMDRVQTENRRIGKFWQRPGSHFRRTHPKRPARGNSANRHRPVEPSAAIKNGGRIDTAWREEYRLLSEVTRRRYPDSFRAPAKVHEILGREKIDALTIRHQGKRNSAGAWEEFSGIGGHSLDALMGSGRHDQQH